MYMVQEKQSRLFQSRIRLNTARTRNWDDTVYIWESPCLWIALYNSTYFQLSQSRVPAKMGDIIEEDFLLPINDAPV